MFMPTDILYLVTFGLGMAAFWLSGHASALLPVMASGPGRLAGLAVTAGVYGLGMLILSLIVTRRFGRGVLLATGIAIILGLGAAQIVTRLAVGHIHNKSDIAILTFVLYLVYGGIYVLALAVGRRFAKPHPSAHNSL